MAYTEFYMQTTGSNLNAGSTNADAASLTYASGNWVASTGVFTVASGDPVADGVVVGDWVSVYVNADTATPYVGKVTARDATTITVSLTDKIGTVPTDGTGTRNIKVGGAWADFGLCATGRAFASNVASTFSARINIKAGTYANTTTSRSLVFSGSTTTPVWYRGYKTTIGDLDALPTTTLVDATDLPLITFTNGTFSPTIGTGLTQIISSLSLVRLSTGSNSVLLSREGNGQSVWFNRCRFENQVAGTTGYAISLTNNTAGAFAFTSCWFKSTSTATRVISADTSANLSFVGCVFEGGGDGFYGGRGTVTFINNLVKSVGGNGFSAASSGARGPIINNIFYGCGSNGIVVLNASTSSQQWVIQNNIFENCLYGVRSDSGTQAGVWLGRNSYYNMTSGHTFGLGDAVDSWELTESASHFTDAGSGDFSLKSTSVAKGAALPQLFENNSNKSWGDLGAVQREEPAGGSGTNFFIPVE